jgi:O-antigen/teichoic acid export membrane protein
MPIGIAAIPFLLHGLGVDRLGVLTLIWALIGYFSIFDFGLGRALTYKVASLQAHGRMDRALGSIKFGLLALLGLGIVCALLVTGAVLIFGISWLNVEPQIYKETHASVIIASAAIPITTLTSGFRGVLEGLEEFGIANILKTLLGFANFLVPVAVVYGYGPDLSLVVLGLLAARLIVMLLYGAVVVRLLLPFKSPSSRGAGDTKELATFGAWLTISNIVSPMMTTSDRFIISHFAGAAVVAYYSVPFDFLFRLLLIPSALTTSLFPVFAGKQMFSEDGRKESRNLYYKATRSVAILMLPLVILIAAFSYYGLDIWLGKTFAQNSYVIVIILSFGVLFNSIAQVPFTVVQATGDARSTALLHLSEFLIYLPIMLYGVSHFGIVAAAAAWLFRMLVDLAVLHWIAIRKLSRGR